MLPITQYAWLHDASCRDNGDGNLALFFSKEKELIKLAKKICFDCPVRHECLEEAMKNRDEAGTWGGLTESERRTARRKRVRRRMQMLNSNPDQQEVTNSEIP